MSGFESFGKNSNNGIDTEKGFTEIEKSLSSESMKDELFDQYLKQQLIEDFFENLEEYLDEDDVDSMRGELAKYDDQEIYSTLSLPHELRNRKFELFKNEIEKGKKANELMRDFIEKSSKHGFSIGYHTSPNDIKPSPEGKWNIIGFEKDHRDDDLSKAYYSTKYHHLFKRKDPKFIYVVRTDPDTHRTDGNWSRAGILSIVTRVPFKDVVDYVENTTRDLQKQKADA